MTFERYIPGEGQNEAGLALAEMMRDIDPHVPYADMMRLRISGAVVSECHDVYYVAREGGRAVARHWNGWGKHPDAIGNWGNFYTDAAFRGKGIGGKLLSLWYEDFADGAERPLCFLCSAGTRELAAYYSRFGFRPALEGTDHGPLYLPVGQSPDTFRAFYEGYYRPSDTVWHRQGRVGYRHEIDCLLRFALLDRGLAFGIDKMPSFEQAFLEEPALCGLLFSKDGHCVGWSYRGNMQVYPLYTGATVVNEFCV